MKRVCTVLTNDGGVKHFDEHDPLRTPNGPLQLNVAFNDVQASVQLRFCKRCFGVYVDSFGQTFVAPPPKPETEVH